MEILSVFHHYIDSRYYLGQGVLDSFFQKGFPPMIQKSLPETIIERAAKITDATLLRQGRVYIAPIKKHDKLRELEKGGN